MSLLSSTRARRTHGMLGWSASYGKVMEQLILKQFTDI